MSAPPTKAILPSAVLLALCYWALAMLALSLTRLPNSVASIWLANAVACAFLVYAQRRHWPALLLAVAVGNTAAELLFGDRLEVALFFSLANVIEISLAAWLVQRSQLADQFNQSPSAMARVMLSAGTVPVMAGASLGAAGLSLMGVGNYAELWLVWFASSCTGMVAMLPLALMWRRHGTWGLLEQFDLLTTSALLLIALSLSILTLLYLHFPFVYLTVPLVLVALYMNAANVALFNSSMAILISIMISLGYFLPPPFTETWQSLLLYLPILVMLIPALLLAASMEQGRIREQAFRLSERRFRGALEFAGTGFCLTTRDGVITEANVRLCEMLGYTRQELIGKRNTDVSHPGDIDISRSKAESLLAGHCNYYSLDKRFLRRSGEMFWAHMTVSLLPGQESDGEAIIQIDDISEVIETQRKLNQLRIAAEKANRTKSEFLANMSHEIRTPMNGVLGITQLLEKTELNATQHQYLDMLRNAGKSLLSVINDILDFSKIEAGHLQLNPSEFDVEQLLCHTSSMMMVLAGNKEIELLIEVDPQAPGRILADRHRVEQVLVNLVGNAVKFTEQGEIELSIRLQSTTEGAWLRFAVRDSGIGIDPAQQSKLFQAFEQVDSSMTRQYGGTGLGLAISKRLVQLMGGQIGVTSTVGLGSTFWFSLPLQQVNPPPTFEQVLAGMPVLLIEPSPHNRNNLQQLLEQLGGTVTAIADANAAPDLLKKARHLEMPYQLIVLDPIGGNIHLHPLTDPGGPLPPTLQMVNAFARERLAQPATQSLLLKPVTRTSLLRTLEEVLVQDDPASSAAAASHAETPALAGRHLLLVEDNPLNQVVARGILEQMGASLTVVGDGQQAVDILQAQPAAFELVLMDVQMPVMDGFTATRLIRQQLHLSLPVLAMSAGVTSSEREQCIEAGMNDFIAKPISSDTLLETLLKHLARPPGSEPTTRAATPAEPASVIFAAAALDQLCASSPLMHQTLAGLVLEILQRGNAPMEEARQAWEQNRPLDVARIVHTLRGGMGTLGAVSLPELTLRLEDAIKQGELAQAEQMLSQLEEEFGLLLEAFARWLEANPLPPST